MQQFIKNIGQAALIFAGLFAAQWFIPYLYLVIGAGGYGVFQLVSEKKKSGWHWIAAALVLGVNAWVYDQYFRTANG